MSTITAKWTEQTIRTVIEKLDEKTGLDGASLPILFCRLEGPLGFFRPGKEKCFAFDSTFFNNPATMEAQVIDVIRHEYAHYYTDAADLKRFFACSALEESHGDDWKWACRMVGADPMRFHIAAFFVGREWSAEKARKAHNAEDIARLDILSYIGRWNRLPLDGETAAKMLSCIRRRNPHAYFDIGQAFIHPQRGYGVVVDTIPQDYWTQNIFVRFADGSDEVLNTKGLNRIVRRVGLPPDTENVPCAG